MTPTTIALIAIEWLALAIVVAALMSRALPPSQDDARHQRGEGERETIRNNHNEAFR